MKFYPTLERSDVTCRLTVADDGDVSLSITSNTRNSRPLAIFAEDHPLYPHWLKVFEAMVLDTQSPTGTTQVERQHDMGQARLKLAVNPDCVEVEILEPGEPSWPSIEFTTPGTGGGRSEATFLALKHFYRALDQGAQQ